MDGHCNLNGLRVLVCVVVPENASEQVAFLLLVPSSEYGGYLIVGYDAYVCVSQTVGLPRLGFCKAFERQIAGDVVSGKVYEVNGSGTDSLIVEVKIVVKVIVK